MSRDPINRVPVVSTGTVELRPDHLPELRWQMIEPETIADPDVSTFTAGNDLFSDGSIVLLPTAKSPGAGDKRQMRDAIAMVNAVRHLHPDLLILAEHDPNAASLLTAGHSQLVQP